MKVRRFRVSRVKVRRVKVSGVKVRRVRVSKVKVRRASKVKVHQHPHAIPISHFERVGGSASARL